jgi:hypothetical protein
MVRRARRDGHGLRLAIAHGAFDTATAALPGNLDAAAPLLASSGWRLAPKGIGSGAAVMPPFRQAAA